MSRNSKKKRDRRKAKQRRIAEARRQQSKAINPDDLVSVEPISPEQLASFLQASPSDESPWTVRVIVSASGRKYKDGENIPMFDQEVLDSWPAETLGEAQEMGDQIESQIASGPNYPDGARVSILSAPEFTFG